MGKTANHAVLFARLITKGKDHGVQPFIIQIRDEKSHMPLSGIQVGDIGAKMAFKLSDNGWMRMTHFR
jgi:acyl-CoA oxidase